MTTATAMTAKELAAQIPISWLCGDPGPPVSKEQSQRIAEGAREEGSSLLGQGASGNG